MWVGQRNLRLRRTIFTFEIFTGAKRKSIFERRRVGVETEFNLLTKIFRHCTRIVPDAFLSHLHRTQEAILVQNVAVRGEIRLVVPRLGEKSRSGDFLHVLNDETERSKEFLRLFTSQKSSIRFSSPKAGPDLLFVVSTRCGSTKTLCIALLKRNMLLLIMPNTTENERILETTNVRNGTDRWSKCRRRPCKPSAPEWSCERICPFLLAD